MKFIPKELEANIVAAVSAALADAGIDGCDVYGTWRTAGNGYVRWIESGTGKAAVFVSVATAIPTTYTTPSVDFNANIELAVRPELDPTGDALLAISKAIENLLRTWQAETYQQAFTALDVEGEFSVGSVGGNTGSAPTIQDGRCIVSWPVTLSGSYINNQQPITSN